MSYNKLLGFDVFMEHNFLLEIWWRLYFSSRCPYAQRVWAAVKYKVNNLIGFDCFCWAIRVFCMLGSLQYDAHQSCEKDRRRFYFQSKFQNHLGYPPW